MSNKPTIEELEKLIDEDPGQIQLQSDGSVKVIDKPTVHRLEDVLAENETPNSKFPWTATHDADGNPVDPIQRWQQREQNPDVPPRKYEHTDDYLARMSEADEQLMADLAALCEEQAKRGASAECALANNPVYISTTQFHRKCMESARKPDGTPRFPRREL